MWVFSGSYVESFADAVSFSTNQTLPQVTETMMRGFGDVCKEAGCEVTGGQTIINPAPIIGGVAKSTPSHRIAAPSIWCQFNGDGLMVPLDGLMLSI